MTIAEHEAKIIDILRYNRELDLFCSQNDIVFLEDAEDEEEVYGGIFKSGILPDGKPVCWETQKKYWHLGDERVT